ncbi:hypothetical protein FRC11_000509, partial [Ceratobasidium sp. 423]
DWGKFIEANAQDFAKNAKQGWTSRLTVLHLWDIPSDSSSVQEADTRQGSTQTCLGSSTMTKKLKQRPMKSRPSCSESAELSTVITSPPMLSLAAKDHDEADIDDYDSDGDDYDGNGDNYASDDDDYNGNGDNYNGEINDDDEIDDELHEIWEKSPHIQLPAHP